MKSYKTYDEKQTTVECEDVHQLPKGKYYVCEDDVPVSILDVGEEIKLYPVWPEIKLLYETAYEGVRKGEDCIPIDCYDIEIGRKDNSTLYARGLLCEDANGKECIFITLRKGFEGNLRIYKIIKREDYSISFKDELLNYVNNQIEAGEITLDNFA